MKKPNVLCILIDDMGWRDLGATGSTFYESPVIDRLMHAGCQFDNAYAACPVCSPSRASLLTGKYPARLGVTDWIDLSGEYHPAKGFMIDAPYVKHLPLEEYSIAKAMKDGGYRTYHVGKWHLGSSAYYPEHQGFDVNIGGCSWGHPHDGYFSPYHIENLSEGPEGEYLTDRITDEAIGLLKANGDKPFFMNLWHYSVHIPIQAKKEDIAYFQAKAKRLHLDEVNPLIEGEHFPTDLKKDLRVARRIFQSDCVYAAMIRNLDWNVGRILDELEREGKAEDTIILFTSDNGGLATSEGSPTCNSPAREGKGWMNEGGNRVPLSITYAHAIAADTHCGYPVTSTDLYPTILSLSGLPLQTDQHVDGVNLSPLFEGKQLPERPIFWHYPHYGNQGGVPSSAVRKGKWKLIEYLDDFHIELYDLDDDIAEVNDLSLSHPAMAKELTRLLHDWREGLHATLPVRNLDWRGCDEK